MTSSQAEETISIVFVALYIPLLALNFFNLVKHGNGKRLAYISLVIFDQVRIAGNAVLVAAYQINKKATLNNDKTIKSLFTGGFVMQSIGYSMLFSATLCLYERGIKKANIPSQYKSYQISGLHVLNTVSTVLLIVGITESSNLFDSTSGGGTVEPIAKAGSYLYCASTAILGFLIIYHVFINKVASQSAQTILQYCLLAMIFLCIRVGYSAYRIQSGQFVNYGLAAHLVCQDIVEFITVIIYTALGFAISRMGGDEDLNKDSPRSDSVEDFKQSGNPTLAESVPVTYRS